MDSIDNILLATDGSESSLKAAAFAGDAARVVNAAIHVVTVHSNELLNVQLMGIAGWPAAAPNSAVSIDELRDSIEANAEKDVLQPAIEALGDLPKGASCTQVWGQAAEVICEFADDNNIDLIIIGSRGRSSFAKLMLGSITVQVLNHAHCPVTVVR